jgi:hypothetical protein
MIKSGYDIEETSKFPFNDLKFTKILKNVIHKDSNINFIFSIPLADFVPNIFVSKSTRSGLFMHQQSEKLTNSRSQNISNVSRMREYDKVMNILEFASKVT